MGFFALAVMEGAFADPGGQINPALKLQCDSGLLANRNVTIRDDGEYNWMLANGQTVNITLTVSGTIHVYWIDWANGNDLVSETYTNQTVQLNFEIHSPGHYQLEMVNYNPGGEVKSPVLVTVYVKASTIDSSLWNCVNIGDLYHTD